MRWAEVNPLPACCFDPSAEDAPAGEDEHMHLAAVEHSQFKVAIERRGGYELPVHLIIFDNQGADALI